MKHLVIAEYGSFLGLDSNRLVVKSGDDAKHYPLNRLCTVSVAKRGVSISSDIIEAFSTRGIKLIFLDFRGVAHSALLGEAQHGVVAVRMAQMSYVKNDALELSKLIVTGKIKNQRAVLNYFNKYHDHQSLSSATTVLKTYYDVAKSSNDISNLLGYEGSSASTYFRALREAGLFSSSFKKREGRGSREINNSLLNYGYAILSSYILSAVINAGLEPYLGVLHGTRPGKMALVLDIMEEYRAWVVDRAVIKLRSQSEGEKALAVKLRKELISDIQRVLGKKYKYNGKKVKLEHIIQRQVYRLCGHFCGEKTYRPYLFKW